MSDFSSSFKSSLTYRVVRGGAIVSLLSILSAPIGYLVRMINSRILSIEEYGLLYSILGIYITLNTFNDLGFAYSLNYLVPKFIKNKQYKKVWLVFKYDQIIEVGSSLIISLIIFATSPILAEHFFKTPAANNTLRILSIYFVAEAFLSSLEKLFNGLQKEILYASIKVFKALLVLILSFSVIRAGRTNILEIAMIWSVSSLIISVVYNFLLHKKNKKIIFPISFDGQLFKKMWKYALPSLALSSVSLIGGTVDNFLLITFGDLNQVGIYNIVLPLAIISPIILTPLSKILFPLLSEIEKDKKNLRKVIGSALKIIPYVALYFGLFVFIFSSPIIETVFGSKWVTDANQPLKIASLGFVLLPILGLFGTIANGIGLIKEKFKISLISLIIRVLLSSVSIYFYEVSGAIVANVLIFAIGSLLTNHYNKKKTFYKIPYKVYFMLGIFSSAIYLLTIFLEISPSGYIQLLLIGIVYTMVYLLLGLISNVVDPFTIKLIIKNRRSFKL
jgi:O-antigen/teichoic acid export membrane protein